MKSEIKQKGNLQWYESEEVPPLGDEIPPFQDVGPKLWYRPSDGAHFSRSNGQWRRYTPANIKCRLKVGESIQVTLPHDPDEHYP